MVVYVRAVGVPVICCDKVVVPVAFRVTVNVPVLVCDRERVDVMVRAAEPVPVFVPLYVNVLVLLLVLVDDCVVVPVFRREAVEETETVAVRV